jgi:hypothetical protein
VSGIEASVQAINEYSAAHYLPRPYAGRLTLFQAAKQYKVLCGSKLGWGDLALDGLDIVELPMYPHAMLVEPFVGLLAKELRARMGGVAGANNLLHGVVRNRLRRVVLAPTNREFLIVDAWASYLWLEAGRPQTSREQSYKKYRLLGEGPRSRVCRGKRRTNPC